MWIRPVFADFYKRHRALAVIFKTLFFYGFLINRISIKNVVAQVFGAVARENILFLIYSSNYFILRSFHLKKNHFHCICILFTFCSVWSFLFSAYCIAYKKEKKSLFLQYQNSVHSLKNTSTESHCYSTPSLCFHTLHCLSFIILFHKHSTVLHQFLHIISSIFFWTVPLHNFNSKQIVHCLIKLSRPHISLYTSVHQNTLF